MKKTVGAFIIVFIVSMLVMVGWGFIDKQIKENMQPQFSTTPSTSKPSSPDQTASPSVATNGYTLWDISNHKTQNDCWVAINGNVYDVTKYLDQHPGGSDLILMVCGKDATRAYKTQGGRGGEHSSRADSQLAEYIIGTLK